MQIIFHRWLARGLSRWLTTGSRRGLTLNRYDTWIKIVLTSGRSVKIYFQIRYEASTKCISKNIIPMVASKVDSLVDLSVDLWGLSLVHY